MKTLNEIITERITKEKAWPQAIQDCIHLVEDIAEEFAQLRIAELEARHQMNSAALRDELEVNTDYAARIKELEAENGRLLSMLVEANNHSRRLLNTHDSGNERERKRIDERAKYLDDNHASDLPKVVRSAKEALEGLDQ